MTQRALIKATAAFLVEDTLTLKGEYMFDNPDPRLVMNGEKFKLPPDRIELWSGIPSPKRWTTPNQLAATRRKEAD